MNPRLEAILEQKAFLDYVERDLDLLVAGKLNEQNQKGVRAVVRSNLALVRERIEKENAYWENSEQLKDLERKLDALEHVTVCAHSAPELPIEVRPGQEHTCKDLAGCSSPALCHCEPVAISLYEFEQRLASGRSKTGRP